MKRILTFLFVGLICTLLFSGMTSMEVYAKSCKHAYNNDICKKCGYIRIHEFQEHILFYTVKENVPVWSEPTKNSQLVRQIEYKDSMINFNGLLRNQYGNIWLRTEDGYVFIDNVYLYFESLVIRSYQQIYALGDEAVLVEFYNTVRPGGPADYKKWLAPGSRGINYNVYINGQFVKMTAEELGNINYGYLGKLIGFTDDILLYAGGAVNLLKIFNTKTWNNSYQEALKKCAVCNSPLCISIEIMCVSSLTPQLIMSDIIKDCSLSYCDTEDDAANVIRGINYYSTGIFE